jgi:hypothetical protein
VQRHIIRRMAVVREGNVRGFGSAGEQPGKLHVVARDGFANFFEDRGGVLKVEGFAEADFF